MGWRRNLGSSEWIAIGSWCLAVFVAQLVLRYKKNESNYSGMRKIFLFLSLVFLMQCSRKEEQPKGDPNNGGIVLPEGFVALVVVDSLGPARHLAVNDNGDIYVKLRYSKQGEAGNVALRDLNQDGKAFFACPLQLIHLSRIYFYLLYTLSARFFLSWNRIYTKNRPGQLPSP